MRASTRCACSRAGARNLLARQASSPRIQLDTTARRSCRGTSPRASGRPCGPVPPLGAASCGLGCVYTPTAPCTPLPPMWGVGRAKHRVSPPHAHSWPSSPPSHWHPRHARARGLAAAARLGRPDPGSPRSVPPPNTPPPIPFPLECKGPPRPLASSPLLLSSPRPLHKRRRLVLLHAPAVALPPACPLLTSS